MAKKELTVSPPLEELEVAEEVLNSNLSEEELLDLPEEKVEGEEYQDPFQCPDDEFLHSVWPLENKGFASFKKHINEGGGIKERIPLQNFGVDTRFFVCPTCKTNLTKGTSFWATSSFIGNLHIDKKPRLIICKKCVAKYYEKLLEHFENDVNKAMFQLCFDFDFYYDQFLIDKLVFWKFHDGSKHPDNKFPDTYLKIITNVGKNNPYKGKTLLSQLGYDNLKLVLGGQYDFEGQRKQMEETKRQLIEEQLSEEDKMHRSKIIATYLYDPFEGFPIEERAKLYRSLFMMIGDPTIAEDVPRLKAAVQICTAYQNIEQISKKIQDLIQSEDNSKEAAENIAKWTSTRATETAIIEKSAKDNGFSMRYSNNTSKGAGTLSGIMKELEESGYDDIVTNFYDIKTSNSIQHIADMSFKSVMEQLQLNENDYTEIIKEQNELVRKLQAKNYQLAEELRLIRVKLNKGRLLRELRKEFVRKGLNTEDIDIILNEEYTVPAEPGEVPGEE